MSGEADRYFSVLALMTGKSEKVIEPFKIVAKARHSINGRGQAF